MKVSKMTWVLNRNSISIVFFVNFHCPICWKVVRSIRLICDCCLVSWQMFRLSWPEIAWPKTIFNASPSLLFVFYQMKNVKRNCLNKTFINFKANIFHLSLFISFRRSTRWSPEYSAWFQLTTGEWNKWNFRLRMFKRCQEKGASGEIFLNSQWFILSSVCVCVCISVVVVFLHTLRLVNIVYLPYHKHKKMWRNREEICDPPHTFHWWKEKNLRRHHRQTWILRENL